MRHEALRETFVHIIVSNSFSVIHPGLVNAAGNSSVIAEPWRRLHISFSVRTTKNGFDHHKRATQRVRENRIRSQA